MKKWRGNQVGKNEPYIQLWRRHIVSRKLNHSQRWFSPLSVGRRVGWVTLAPLGGEESRLGNCHPLSGEDCDLEWQLLPQTWSQIRPAVTWSFCFPNGRRSLRRRVYVSGSNKVQSSGTMMDHADCYRNWSINKLVLT